MKYILPLLVLISTSAFAKTISWSDLTPNKTYTLTQEINLEKATDKVSLPENADLKLQEKMSLPMIKVELYKFDISKYCADSEFTTDISLIDIKQAGGKVVTVGADVAEECLLEVYVETTDLYSTSIFK